MDAKRGTSSLDGQGGSKKRHRSEGNAASTAPQEEMISSQASNAVDPSKDNSEVERLARLLGNQEVKKKLGLVTMADHEQLKADHEKLKERTSQLEYRMDGIAKAFEPATQHAFFETVIYKFCRASVSVMLFTQPERVRDAQYAMSVVAKKVLKHLWTEDDNELRSLHIPKFGTSHRASRRRNSCSPDQLPNPSARDWEKSVLKMLQGLMEFLNYSKGEVIDDLVANGQDHRNTVSHDGEFLDSLFGSPKKDRATKELYAKRKTQLKEGRSHFEGMIGQTGPNTLESALKDVSDAIWNKRSIENGRSFEQREEQVLQALTNLLQP